jgi:hypothetical protein
MNGQDLDADGIWPVTGALQQKGLGWFVAE